MQNVKIKKILIFFTILILFGLGCFIYSWNRTFNKIAKKTSDDIINPVVNLTNIATLYYEENSKWPHNSTELQEFAITHGVNLNLDKFESISFLPKPNGNLGIEVTISKDYTHEVGKIEVGKITGQWTSEISPPQNNE